MIKKLASILIIVTFCFGTAFAETRREQIENLIKIYGKQDIIDVILSMSDTNQMTVHIGKKLYVRQGRPSHEYVTFYSINNDLKRLGVSVDQLASTIDSSKKKKIERIQTVKSYPKKSSFILEKEKRNSAENSIPLQRLSDFIDKTSTIGDVVIREKNGVKFYETNRSEKYNTFKLIVLYFWYYPSQDQLKLSYETNTGKFKKILIKRENLERVTGELNTISRKKAEELRYNKAMAIRMFDFYTPL